MRLLEQLLEAKVKAFGVPLTVCSSEGGGLWVGSVRIGRCAGSRRGWA
jgi:hypothetical protein